MDEIQFNEKIKSICRKVYDNNKDDSGDDESTRNRFVYEVVCIMGEMLQLYEESSLNRNE